MTLRKLLERRAFKRNLRTLPIHLDAWGTVNDVSPAERAYDATRPLYVPQEPPF